MKKGVNTSDHTICYTSKNPVNDTTNSTGVNGHAKAALRVPTWTIDRMAPASRINYSKLYTIESNIRLADIGQISQQHEGEHDLNSQLPFQPRCEDCMIDLALIDAAAVKSYQENPRNWEEQNWDGEYRKAPQWTPSPGPLAGISLEIALLMGTSFLWLRVQPPSQLMSSVSSQK